MSVVNSITLTTSYTNSEYKRKYKIDEVESDALINAKAKILAINESLAGGTDNGLADFIVADDYDGTNGKLQAITAAIIESVSETEIKLYEG